MKSLYKKLTSFYQYHSYHGAKLCKRHKSRGKLKRKLKFIQKG
ncbi:hypothetical protein OLCHANIL_00008 [Vibrio phage V05]|uniref:Uncharacterized protein n=1 Tax=Vibrio phage VH1_2019 TaxID=2686307 RepID=A0A6B9SVV4_9CAUD|nr:hypothetical protein VH12019_00176 [Vibrio phage VH1_2019]QIW90112.1 hypothetical protein OLCHANIL_00008 [Vibrio phage V05]